MQRTPCVPACEPHQSCNLTHGRKMPWIYTLTLNAASASCPLKPTCAQKTAKTTMLQGGNNNESNTIKIAKFIVSDRDLYISTNVSSIVFSFPHVHQTAVGIWGMELFFKTLPHSRENSPQIEPCWFRNNVVEWGLRASWACLCAPVREILTYWWCG